MINTIDEKEIQQFTKDSSHWWDENGPFKPLHRLNPVRMAYIKAQICEAYGREYTDLKALKGLSIVDIGCGGGLVCEPLARLGASVTGLDADANAIAVAQEHAAQSGLKIDYRNESAEGHYSSLASQPSLSSRPLSSSRGLTTGSMDTAIKSRYDAVLALEIIEHVSDVDGFVESCKKLCKPGGLIIFSTLNRTPQSFALGIVAAEYILRWVPRGTHNWKKFLKPSELSRLARKNDLSPLDVMGLHYDPVTDSFSLDHKRTDVNYFLSCRN